MTARRRRFVGVFIQTIARGKKKPLLLTRHTNNAFLYILHFSVETNQALCQEQEIKSYPTLIAFKGGSKAGAYRGDRSLEALKSFVNTNKVAA